MHTHSNAICRSDASITMPTPAIPARPVPEEKPTTTSAGKAFMNPTAVTFPSELNTPISSVAKRLIENPIVLLLT